MKELEKYRTWSVALVAIVALVYCATSKVTGEDLQAVKWGLVAIVGLVAGRAIGTAAASGGGLKGITRALLTDAKPGAQP